jgi:hypothetical protein
VRYAVVAPDCIAVVSRKCRVRHGRDAKYPTPPESPPAGFSFGLRSLQTPSTAADAPRGIQSAHPWCQCSDVVAVLTVMLAWPSRMGLAQPVQRALMAPLRMRTAGLPPAG